MMDKSEKRFERDFETFLLSEAGGHQRFSKIRSLHISR